MAVVNIPPWVNVGGIAGWLAGTVVQGIGFGVIGDVIVDIVGALIGGFVLSLLLSGTFGFTGFKLGSLIVAFISAVILLFIVKVFTGRRAVSQALRLGSPLQYETRGRPRQGCCDATGMSRPPFCFSGPFFT